MSTRTQGRTTLSTPRALLTRNGQQLDYYFQRLRDVVEGKRYLLAALIARGLKRPTVLFYPGKSSPGYAIYKVLHRAGCRISTNPNKPFDVAIYWEGSTVRTPDAKLIALSKQCEILNLGCQDISKVRVSAAFAQVFGYSIDIDPRTHHGKCVRKSDENAKHDGQIIECPVAEFDSKYVFQKVINNQVGDDLVEDIRVPVFRDDIPFVYLKYRKLATRFLNTNDSARIARVHDYLSTEEIEQIVLFCREIGLDYGELDVVRDRDDGRIYILDANTTPWGPPNHLSAEGRRLAIEKLAIAFEESILKLE